MLGLLSALPGQVHNDTALLALTGIDVHNIILPRSRGRLELGVLGTRGRLFICGVCLPAALCTIGTVGIGAGARSLLALLCRLLLFLPSREQRLPSPDLGQVSVEYLGCRFSAGI